MKNSLDINNSLSLVIVGHVDHGKSTIIGRLLADTNSLPEGKLEQVKVNCRRNSKPFEYAFLLDALKDEQSQGITIDSARCFFKTKFRNYILIDAPGHIEFLKNMITGAARAEAAILTIDAFEGVQENSRRHGYMLSMLGIRQVAVVVNKMDLVDYNEKKYKKIVTEYRKFLKQIDINPICFIPASAMMGDNIASRSEKTPWHNGYTVLEILDSFKAEESQENKPFRMPIQDVYKFTKDGDNRRIIAGTIETGTINVGDEVVFYPSGKKSKVRSFEAFNKDYEKSVSAGVATGFTLEEQIYITRGELAVRGDERKPKVTTRIKTNIFWLGKTPLIQNKKYFLKIGTSNVEMELEEIITVLNSSNLSSSKKDKVERHEVAECILTLSKEIAFDLAGDLDITSRFVIVDGYEISGGGIIIKDLSDSQSSLREKVQLRNYKWIKSGITQEERAERFNQKASLIIITGKKQSKRKELARLLERKLFEEGKIVYYLGIGNVLYGIDADIKNNEDGNNKEEHIRRFAEVANIMLDSGAILIITAVELNNRDLKIIDTVVNAQSIETIWLGDEVTTDITEYIHISQVENELNAVERIKRRMQDKGSIFKPS